MPWFARNRIEMLTAKAWLANDEKLKAGVVGLSCAASMPCA